MGRPMTKEEQLDHAADERRLTTALKLLASMKFQDEDVRVARARLENWLAENRGRWTTQD